LKHRIRAMMTVSFQMQIKYNDAATERIIVKLENKTTKAQTA
jgi:hypothetical protein